MTGPAVDSRRGPPAQSHSSGVRPGRARRRGRRQHRPVAPRHARDDPGHRRAGRRARAARRRALRIPAPRLREGMRRPHVAQPHSLCRPAQLLQRAHQRFRVLRGGRDAHGRRDHAALPLFAHAPVGVLAPRRPPHLRGRIADGAGGDDRLPLSRDDPRLHLRAPGRPDGRARDLHVWPYRRARPRSARRLAHPPCRDPRAVRDVHRAHPRAHGPQPDLHRPHARRRRHLDGRSDQLRLHRADPALDRIAARLAQGHALPRVRRARFRGAGRHQGRQLRPLLLACGRWTSPCT